MPAFIGAEGFGRNSIGGRGGSVIFVENLNAFGTGSFQEALATVGPRTIIFRVGGIITWREGNPTVPPFCTIAGHTAPGDGIMLTQFQLQFRNTNNIICRYLRVRPSEDNPSPASHGSLEVFQANTVIFDHCSAGWATDDTLAGSSAHSVTFQWCLTSEGLSSFNRGKYSFWDFQSVAGLGVSFLHNLVTNYNDRLPTIQSGDVQVVNEVMYNSNHGAQVFPESGDLACNVEYVNNHLLVGPNTPNPLIGAAFQSLGCGYIPAVDCALAAASRIFLSGNFHNIKRPNNTLPETDIMIQRGSPVIPVVTTPLGFPTIDSEVDAQQARIEVLARSGATIPVRDSIDQRAIDDVNNGTGRWPVTIAEVGGYPVYNSASPYVDTNSNGMSDEFEQRLSVSNHNGMEISISRALNEPYTNLEWFLMELAGDVNLVAPPPSVDTTPPTIPQNLSGIAVSSSEIALTWDASSDIGGGVVAGYNVYRNGGLIGSTTTALNFSDSGRTAETLFVYNVTALDDSGNESAFSNDAQVTTLGPPPPLTDNGAITAPLAASVQCVNMYFAVEWDTTKFNGPVEISFGLGQDPSVWTVATPNYENNGKYIHKPTFSDNQVRVRIREVNDLGNFDRGPGTMIFEVCAFRLPFAIVK